MQLVLKVSKIISRTSWRTLSLSGLLCWLILFSWHVSFITRLYLVPEVFLLVKKGLLLHIFTDYINPKISILLRPAVSSKMLVHISPADLLGGLRPVSPQPCKRSQVETESGFSCLQENSSKEKLVSLIAAFRSHKVLLGHRRQYFRITPYPGF